MFHKSFKKVLITIIIFCLLLSTTGVYASWIYAGGGVNPQNSKLNILGFTWSGSDVLPDDDSSGIGENHILLITNILQEENYGLNATKKPIIHQSLNKAGDVVYCEQNVQGGNLKHLMIDGTDSYALLFQIEYVSDTEYNLYTYARTIKALSVGSSIEVFLTIVSSNSAGVWDATASYLGTATVINPSKVTRAIDSATFKKTVTT